MEKVLLLRLSSLGDVVLTSVLLDPLVEGGFRPYLLTFEPYHTLFEDDPRVETIPVTKGSLFSRETLKRLKGFDLYLDLHKNLRSFLVRFLTGGRWVSYKKEALRRRLSVHFKVFRKRFYVPERYLEVLKPLGLSGDPFPKILVSKERLRKVGSLLPDKDFVAIGPGARYRKKIYPHFGEVAKMLKDQGFEVVWVGDTEDRSLAEGLPGINLCGKTSLPDLLAVLKLAKLYIGNDSGILHCARAVGTKAVQIYGGTHPTLGFSLYPEEGVVLVRGLPCQPCDPHGKGNCKFRDYRCLEIDPEIVFEESMRILQSLKLKKVG